MLTEDLILSKNPDCKAISLIKKLNIYSNDISDITILSKMKSIEILSLSSNKISSLYPLSKCENLRELYLINDKVSSFNELYFLKNLKQLKVLWLEGNPISYVDNYVGEVIKILPNLHSLDNKNLAEYKNIKNRNKYIKRVLTEEKKVRLDEYKSKCNLNNSIMNKNKKKLFLKRIVSYFSNSNDVRSIENANNYRNNNNNIKNLKCITHDKEKSEKKKEINFKNIKLKFKNHKRSKFNKILINDYLKKYPKLTNSIKQTVDVNSNNININSKKEIKTINTVENIFTHRSSSVFQTSSTINSNFLFKGKNILNENIKHNNAKNLKLYKLCEKKNIDNNYVMAVTLLVKKMNIEDLLLLKQVINKKIENLTK